MFKLVLLLALAAVAHSSVVGWGWGNDGWGGWGGHGAWGVAPAAWGWTGANAAPHAGATLAVAAANRDAQVAEAAANTRANWAGHWGAGRWGGWGGHWW